MSEPQQPPVPPSAQPDPAFPPAPPAPHLPAAPQYTAGAPQQPAAPQPPQAPQYQAPQYQAPQYQAPQQQQYQTAPQPPYGQQAAYGQQRPSAPRSANPLARTAFIIALVVAAVGALQVLLQPFVLASFSYDAGSYGVFSLFFGIIIFLGSAAALVLGLIAVRRPGGQVLAGIAIGIGGVQLLGIVLAWISSLFYNFF